MSDDRKTKQILIIDAKTGATRLSEPVSIRTPRPDHADHKPDRDSAASTAGSRSPKERTDLPQTPSGNSSVSGPHPGTTAEGSQALPDTRSLSGEAASGERAGQGGAASKTKGKIETLEQFISYAYARKGQPLKLDSKTERRIGQNPTLDDNALARLEALADADPVFAVPRQLLLVSHEIAGTPVLRGALREFVGAVIARHPMFAEPGLLAAVRNLPDSPSMAEALSSIARYTPTETEGSLRKPAEILTLRRNASHLLALWFVCQRGLSIDSASLLLFKASWEPAARALTNDSVRFRALTEIEETAGVGLACSSFYQQSIEARKGQEQAQRESLTLREKLSTLEQRCDVLQSELQERTRELAALRESSAAALAELHGEQEAERMHSQHNLTQLRGRIVRRLEDSIAMLEVGLNALRNKTPRTEVMDERAEHVIDALRADLLNLKED